MFKMLPLIAIGVIHAMAQAQFLSPQQIDRLPSLPADRRIHYGSEPFQFGDLRLPQAPGSHFLFKEPLRVVGVVNLAGVVDLEAFLPMQNQACGEPVITKLIGGSPTEVPDSPKGTLRERYRLASPSNLLPLGVKQVLIYGAQDKLVPPEFGQKYAEAARKMGDDVTFAAIENTSHFELIAPGSEAGDRVENAVLSMLKLKNKESEKIGVQK
ncbi:hypothetical protein Cha6605_2247 [Chamaesiphon minutus PCC 6605]|uniref:Peptidase S9 prolyl oligopeptidase catalytic domain-containing protein n=2 Tax=Chamaesiphon TaxID=217161 RepID=K9UEU7_CHAP6|nr:hypothetical protein Cha6605_2247 [Chamaesiphon minutus PCC 6605]